MVVGAWESTEVWPKQVAHRTPICESVNMQNVPLPRLTYQVRNAALHAEGKLSTFQFETVAFACQALQKVGAFLLGDATGVGKTRVLGAIAGELQDHKVLWLSVNTRLLRELNAEMDAVGLDGFTLSAGAGRRIFESYAGLLHGAKFDALRAWIGSGPTLLILDEAHMCRNDSATFKHVDALASLATRVLYCSATAASNIRHLRYLNRLRIWGPGRAFATCAELTSAMRQNSVSAMELLCLQLKREGLCLAREISFDGVELRYETVRLSAAQRRVYDYFSRALTRVPAANERYQLFHTLLVLFKIEAAVAIARDALCAGMAPIISLQSTGEAALLRGHGMLDEILCKCNVPRPPEWADTTPANPLDLLLERLGGPTVVAELSGRSHRRDGGALARTPPTKSEVDAFQSGRKRVALLTRAGSTGISLHDEDGRRRINIVLQLPWSSEEFLQQAGRCHRTNQKSVPAYVVLTTDVPGEARLTHCVAARLESLGALTHGERRTHLSCAAEGSAASDWGVCARRQAMLEIFVRAHPTQEVPPQGLLNDLPARAMARDALFLSWIDGLARADPSLPWTASQIAAAVCVFHPELSYVSVAWTRKAHLRFPKEVRRRIEAVLMSAARVETVRTVGALPSSVLDLVCEKFAADPWAGHSEAEAVDGALRAIGVGAVAFTAASAESAMNMLLRLPLRAQEVLARLVAWNSQARSTDARVVPFEQFVARKGLTFRIVNIRRVCILGSVTDAERDGVAVAVVASAEDRPDLPDAASVVQDSLTGQLVGVERRDHMVYLWAPGEHPRAVAVKQWEHSSGGGRYRLQGDEARADWFQLHRRRIGVDRARATRASKTYNFVVHNALGAWQSSKRKVVLLPDAHGIGVWWD